MTGKQTLIKIQATAKKYKKAKTAAIKATKEAEKLKAALDKMVDKFPAKEAELYAEKVKKIVDDL